MIRIIFADTGPSISSRAARAGTDERDNRRIKSGLSIAGINSDYALKSIGIFT
jgi:hypothetical protein